VTISQTRRTLHLLERTLGDYQAVKHGRVGRRITNRLLGRAVGRMMRRVWR
jgi:hypothetical protein